MDQIELGIEVFDLIFLQVPDKMPTNILSINLIDFGNGFLNFIFTEIF